MVTSERQTELEMLRAEVAALKKEREEKVLTVPEEEAQPIEDGDDSPDLKDQLQELVDALEVELKDTNPMTLLIVFALGILLGRLLPR